MSFDKQFGLVNFATINGNDSFIIKAENSIKNPEKKFVLIDF